MRSLDPRAGSNAFGRCPEGVRPTNARYCQARRTQNVAFGSALLHERTARERLTGSARKPCVSASRSISQLGPPSSVAVGRSVRAGQSRFCQLSLRERQEKVPDARQRPPPSAAAGAMESPAGKEGRPATAPAQISPGQKGTTRGPCLAAPQQPPMPPLRRFGLDWAPMDPLGPWDASRGAGEPPVAISISPLGPGGP